MNRVVPPSAAFSWPCVPLDPAKVVALTDSLISAGVRYGFGAKASPLSLQAGEFKRVDCSGFVRWCVFHATGQGLLMPDGSVNQHAWLDENGFKVSDFEAGALKDGAVRVAVLSPSDSLDKIGHIVLITGGETCESHGGKGVDRRPWGSRPYHSKCKIWVMSPPESTKRPKLG